MAFAFRCKTCGRLASSADAGERETPASCAICGAGVSFDPKTGIKAYDPDNWEKLADLHADEKKTLAKDHDVPVEELIEEHTPAEPPEGTPDREPTSISRETNESLGQEDKA
jgi:transcription elongation factor Elf1